MGSRHERGLVEDALDSGVGALAGGATGAVGHGDEIGAQWRQPRDRFPQRLLHLLGLGRKKLEGDADAPFAAVVDEAALARGDRGIGAHQATSRSAMAMRGSRPSQSETAILPPEFCSGARLCWRTTSRPRSEERRV